MVQMFLQTTANSYRLRVQAKIWIRQKLILPRDYFVRTLRMQSFLYLYPQSYVTKQDQQEKFNGIFKKENTRRRQSCF
jgi:hypothetical protein